jgi:hypothetical protein
MSRELRAEVGGRAGWCVRSDVKGNDLTGSVPSELAQLDALEKLCVSRVNTQGQAVVRSGTVRRWFRASRPLTGESAYMPSPPPRPWF